MNSFEYHVQRVRQFSRFKTAVKVNSSFDNIWTKMAFNGRITSNTRRPFKSGRVGLFAAENLYSSSATTVTRRKPIREHTRGELRRRNGFCFLFHAASRLGFSCSTYQQWIQETIHSRTADGYSTMLQYTSHSTRTVHVRHFPCYFFIGHKIIQVYTCIIK